MAVVNKITILAVGLIGGSLAKALRNKGFAGEIVAWGRKETNLKRAVELGIVDSYELVLADAVKDADIVVVATPTLIAEEMFRQLAALLPETTIITDVASVKGNLLRAAKQAFGAVPPNLVLGHPIAGSEQSGVEACNPELFINHRVILTPSAETDPAAVQTIKTMWETTGAELVCMDVEKHDRVLAATSHLPHVLAYSLVDALAGKPEQQDIFRFAAGGFRDFTRIASSDPIMWKDISLANTEAILESLDLFTANLAVLRDAIERGDGEALVETFARAKAARDKFAEMLAKENR